MAGRGRSLPFTPMSTAHADSSSTPKMLFYLACEGAIILPSSSGHTFKSIEEAKPFGAYIYACPHASTKPQFTKYTKLCRFAAYNFFEGDNSQSQVFKYLVGFKDHTLRLLQNDFQLLDDKLKEVDSAFDEGGFYGLEAIKKLLQQFQDTDPTLKDRILTPIASRAGIRELLNQKLGKIRNLRSDDIVESLEARRSALQKLIENFEKIGKTLHTTAELLQASDQQEGISEESPLKHQPVDGAEIATDMRRLMIESRLLVENALIAMLDVWLVPVRELDSIELTLTPHSVHEISAPVRFLHLKSNKRKWAERLAGTAILGAAGCVVYNAFPDLFGGADLVEAVTSGTLNETEGMDSTPVTSIKTTEGMDSTPVTSIKTTEGMDSTSVKLIKTTEGMDSTSVKLIKTTEGMDSTSKTPIPSSTSDWSSLWKYTTNAPVIQIPATSPPVKDPSLTSKFGAIWKVLTWGRRRGTS